MGKISDLFVRLGLKKDEFDRGINDVKKKTDGLKGTFGKMKGAALGVWAAIGTAVVKVGKDMVQSTKSMQDSWDMFCSKAKSSWDTFVRSLVSNDSFSTFFGKLKTELGLVENLTQVLQGDGEILASLRLQKAKIAGELAELETTMMDVNKPLNERIAAGKRYKQLLFPIYEQEIQRLKKLKDARYKAFLGNLWTGDSYKNPTNQKIWDQFFMDYGDQERFDEIGGLTFAGAITKLLNKPTLKNSKDFKEQQENKQAINEYLKWVDDFDNWARERYGFTGSFSFSAGIIEPFFKNYLNNRNQAEIDEMVNIIEALMNAESLFTRDTKKINTRLNGLIKQLADLNKPTEVTFEEINPWDIEDEPIEITPVKIDWGNVDEELDAFVDKWRKTQEEIAMLNGMLEQSIAQAVTGGAEALTDLMMGVEGANLSTVMAGLLEPIASTMMQLGEMLILEGLAIEAFKESLINLNGPVAIGAGVALIATASLLRSGIKALGQSAGATSASTYSGGSGSSGMQPIQSELTIYVQGKISGSDIVLSGNKTLKNWSR